MLADKAIVITGAGRGIGAEIAKLAASMGALVTVNDIELDYAAQTVAAITAAGGIAIARGGDIASWQGAASIIDGCVENFGRIDGLVNNAGLHFMARLEETSEAALRKLIEVNVLGTAFCAAQAIKYMQKARRGSIVNVSSGAQAGAVAMSGYGASKGAVATFTYAWALENAEFCIRVNAISPMANTRMHDDTNAYLVAHGLAPVPASAPAQATAPLVCYLLADSSAALNGQIVRLDGNKLSLLTHPAISLPIVERDDWDFDGIANAFKDDLSKRQMPLGIAAMEVRLPGS